MAAADITAATTTATIVAADWIKATWTTMNTAAAAAKVAETLTWATQCSPIVSHSCRWRGR